MRKSHCLSFLSFFLLFLMSCGRSGGSGAFPMEKKYWTDEDYQTVNDELTNLKYNDKELPNLDNPKTADVFRKIVDTSNVSVVATDNQLGIKHRSEFTSKIFDEYRSLVSAYSGIDRTDKYQYPVEFVEILKFGLPLQIYYITMNNENNIKNSDDPKSQQVVDLLVRNQNVLVGNFELYLDYINFEDRFNEKALASYSEGLKDFFPRLIDAAPNGDYSGMAVKIDNMLKKSKNQPIIAQLEILKGLIKNKISSH